ncbi:MULTISPECIES: hypothetical protein [Gordonibacter]|uniref:hypothetical protein n=1 Tax=Gordonibacter TaxID=644652 RepID=UPI00260FB20E|nr:hypothetical protein [Gordonibacter sp. RACS_AR68]MDN4470951.1 hypothetical protein [Gordonibacter sp. RACS_AR68]
MKPSFGFVFTLSLIMSLVVGVVMTFTMTMFNGQPFMLVPLCLQIAVATVIGLVIMLVLPVAQAGEKFAAFYGAERTGLAWGLLQSLVIATVMTFCVSFGMTAFATGFGDMPDGSTFLMRWLTPITSVWGVSYIATILFLPVATFVARKVGKAPGPVPAPVKEPGTTR